MEGGGCGGRRLWREEADATIKSIDQLLGQRLVTSPADSTSYLFKTTSIRFHKELKQPGGLVLSPP